MVQKPFCLGRLRVAMVEAVKGVGSGRGRLDRKLPGSAGKNIYLFARVKTLAPDVNLTAKETPPTTEVKLIFLLMMLVEVARIGDGSPKPK